MAHHERLGCKENPESSLSTTDPKADPQNFLLEAYKKHSTELVSIEDRENKFLALISAGYVAGATATSTIDLRGYPHLACFFVVIVVLSAALGRHVVHEAHDLRQAVRDMLVRCELAMDFYKSGAFLKGRPLYGDAERCYAGKGGSRPLFGYAIVLVGGALLTVLIIVNYYHGPLPRPSPERVCVNGPC